MPEHNDNSPAMGEAVIEMHEEAIRPNSTPVELPGRDLVPKHAKLLTDHAIDLDKVNGQIRSAIEPADLPAYADPWWRQKLPATLFRYSHGGLTEWQLRPDHPNGDAKYLFREGSEPPVNCMRDDGGKGPILLVEGTKQHLAAYCYADPALAIYGMFGCWGWSNRDLTFAADRLIYVFLDADLATNRDVWNAAPALRNHLIKTVKAAGVRFVILPGAGSQGLDDYLSTIEEDGRTQAWPTSWTAPGICRRRQRPRRPTSTATPTSRATTTATWPPSGPPRRPTWGSGTRSRSTAPSSATTPCWGCGGPCGPS
jgi:hypothetical protein